MTLSTYRTALVTGASGGIGRALVARLRAAGVAVHAVSRDAAVLERLAAETGCIAHAIDIADTGALEALLAELPLDILINNAGVARPGTLVENSAADVDAQVDVNIGAVLQLARIVMPGMMARDRGHILTVGSMAGHYSFGGNAAYHATKAAVHMLCRQLRYDLFGTKVRVTEITPGRVETEMFAKTYGQDLEQTAKQFFDGFAPLQPGDIADAVLYALETPTHVNVSHIEILPTSQVPGGLRIAKA